MSQEKLLKAYRKEEEKPLLSFLVQTGVIRQLVQVNFSSEVSCFPLKVC
jgi:hypothetical protein